MSTFGTGSTNTIGASITLTAFSGTNGVQAGTDGLVPGPATLQQDYLLGAGGDWTLNIKGGIALAESSDRIATTEFVQDVVGNAVLAGNAQLSALSDVTIAGLADDQFLQYDLGTGKWKNATLNLSLISDVNLAGLADGNTIVWDNAGGEWVPGVGGGGGANNLTDLGDVTIAGGAEFHFLVRNGAGQYVNQLVSSADLSNNAEIILRDGSVTFTGHVSLGDFNLTNVGDVALDTISADGTTVSVSMTDNTDSAFSIKEGNTSYITLNTTDNSENIVFNKPSAFNFKVDFHNDVVINEAGNGIDFRVETGTKTHAIFSDGGADRVGIFQNAPSVPLDVVGDTKITGALELTGNITASNLGTASANATGDFLASNSSIDDLNDVALGGALVNGKILKVVAGEITQADETDTNTQLTNEQVQDIVGDMVAGGVETDITVSYDDAGGKLNFVVDNTIARLSDPDLTGTPTAPTAGQGTDTTQIATTAYVQTEITTLNLGTASQSAVGDFLASTVGINSLSDVDTTNKADGKILKFNAGGNLVVSDEVSRTDEQIEDLVGTMFTANNAGNTHLTFAYDDTEGANDGTITATVSLASTDLTNTGNISLLDGDQTLSGDKVFTGIVNLTGSTATATSQGASDNSTKVATTAYVDAQIDADIVTLDLGNTYQGLDATLTALAGVATVADKIIYATGVDVFSTTDITANARTFLGSNTSVNDISDVLIAGVVNAQILVFDNDAGDNDDQWKNVSLSGDITISNAGVATIGNSKVTNGKLENSSLTVGSTAISLGATSTTLAGMTAIDFTNADATIGASMTTNLGNPTNLTLGGAGSKVVISGDLQISGTTTTVNTTNLAVADRVISLNKGGVNNKDIGLFFDRANLDPALFIWSHTDQNFKLGTENGATDEQVGDYTLSLKGLEVVTPALGDDSNLASTTAWVNDYFQPLDATLTALAGVGTGADKLIYATGADAFSTTDLSAFGRSIIDDADAGAVRTTLGLGTASTSNTGDFLASNSGLNDLSNVTIAGGADKHFLVKNGAGAYENRLISSTDLSNVADIAFLASPVLTGNPTAPTQAQGNNSTRIATTAYVETEIGSTSVGGLSDVDLTNLNDTDGHVLAWSAANDRFEAVANDANYTDEEVRDVAGTALEGGTHTGISFSNNDVGNTIDATVSLTSFSVGALSNVTLDGNETTKHLLAHNGAGQFVNRTISSSDLSNTSNIALLDGAQTFADGVKATTQAKANDTTKVATTAFVQLQLADTALTGTPTAPTAVTNTNTTQVATTAFVTQEIGNTEAKELSDISTTDPTNGQVLKYTTDAGANQNKYVPITLGTASTVDTGTSNGETPVLTTHYLSALSANETADLIIKGRYIETIDYGLVSDAFNVNNDFALDFNGDGLNDTFLNLVVIYAEEDYGVLVC